MTKVEIGKAAISDVIPNFVLRRKWSTCVVVLRLICAVTLVVLLLCGDGWSGPRYKLLHSFGTGNGGGGLWGGLALDGKSRLYGTTIGGGTHNGGTVFELSHSVGRWNETVLHNFYYRVDGNSPHGDLAFDVAGDLYGTLSTGGLHQAGGIFELTRGSNGWTETVLHSFCSARQCEDGIGPFSGLILDSFGNLYGTSSGGGKYGDGTVFELTSGSKSWTENVLYSFCPASPCVDGDAPYAGLASDTAGNLYGTTEFGGKGQLGGLGGGTAFQLKHKADGTWQHILLHSFPSFPGDGQIVYAGLVLDKAGNLYGATQSGGGASSTGGTIFKLSRTANGQWKETILYRFPKSL